MHVLHVVGARPNFVKLAPVHAALAGRGTRQTVVHTGQHYEAMMSEVFFAELEMPEPDVNLGIGSASHAVQTGETMIRFEPVLSEHDPDWVVVYGDVNSTLAAALVCAKRGVKVAHVEAGLRCRDRGMPEEINRVLTDQLADLLLTPSAAADRNLEAEGVPPERIVRVGNVMIDSLMRFKSKAGLRWPRLRLELGLESFGLLTLHRPSNVDDAGKLRRLLQVVATLSERLPFVFPVHPRTRARIESAGVVLPATVQMTEPFGYLDFLALQQNATVMITDSGGLQEESTVLGLPCLTMRSSTERPDTVTMGTSTLIGDDLELLQREFRKTLEGGAKRGAVPPLWEGEAAGRIADALGAPPP